MITLISYLIVMVGAFNWFCIGVLQFDFIAGMFGSQANIFSRLVYAIVGFSAIWLLYATIKSKGRILVNVKREEDEIILYKMKSKLTKDDSQKQEQRQEPKVQNAEYAEESGVTNMQTENATTNQTNEQSE